VAIQTEQIPLALRERPQWVGFHIGPEVKADGTPKKTPYNVLTGGIASHSDPATWTTFEAAYAAYLRGECVAIAYCFSADDPYFGYDSDHCIDLATGAVAPETQRWIDALGTYAEASVSLTGIHAIGIGILEGPGRHPSAPDMELYDRTRFFIMTGRRLDGTPLEPQLANGALSELYRHLSPAPAIALAPSTARLGGSALSDVEVVEKAMAAKNGASFAALWAGDTGAYDHDDSRADMALVGLLAFWTGCDAAQIDRLFRGSGLMRPKWDSKRPGGTYGGQTIGRAIATTATVYTPAPQQGDGAPEHHAEQAEVAQLRAERDAARAEAERLAAQRDRLAAEAAALAGRVDELETAGAAETIRALELRLKREQSRHGRVMRALEDGVLSHGSARHIARIIDMTGAFPEPVVLGEPASEQPETAIWRREMAAKLGLAENTVSHILKEAYDRGHIGRRIDTERTEDARGEITWRSRTVVSPGATTLNTAYMPTRRTTNAAHKASVSAYHQQRYQEVLEQASAYAQRHGCACCGADLQPTAYSCPACHTRYDAETLAAYPVIDDACAPAPEPLEAVADSATQSIDLGWVADSATNEISEVNHVAVALERPWWPCICGYACWSRGAEVGWYCANCGRLPEAPPLPVSDSRADRAPPGADEWGVPLVAGAGWAERGQP
jgi:hypothetical protein